MGEYDYQQALPNTNTLVTVGQHTLTTHMKRAPTNPLGER